MSADRRSGTFDRRWIGRDFEGTRYHPERRKDAKLRVELNARAAVIMAALPAPPLPQNSGLKTGSVKYGIYATLRHG